LWGKWDIWQNAANDTLQHFHDHGNGFLLIPFCISLRIPSVADSCKFLIYGENPVGDMGISLWPVGAHSIRYVDKGFVIANI